ncbi:hypothetical protein PPERSA_05947 [Pseudocohnilembus persalinus]|uniref:Clu domain-containing protein n=1 Tax=Pseudocohnilembus persalinus TaxID=266149 RepID=A0A0V0R484_PSEPJ|nr:hypothetical protein PPERSA_05947 [Pseudocohnilembus persalinus]|eukprot:KRX09278.1 hypothetical protein PPERSA_05947 [Pseudocohnilembus persalinus]
MEQERYTRQIEKKQREQREREIQKQEMKLKEINKKEMNSKEFRQILKQEKIKLEKMKAEKLKIMNPQKYKMKMIVQKDKITFHDSNQLNQQQKNILKSTTQANKGHNQAKNSINVNQEDSENNLIIWIFKFHKPFPSSLQRDKEEEDLEREAQLFEQEKKREQEERDKKMVEEYQKQQLEQQKFIEQTKKEMQKKQQEEEEKQKKMQQELQRKKEQEEYEKQNKIVKEQEEKKIKEKMEKLEQAWEFRFHNYWELCANKEEDNYETSFKCGIKLYKLIGEFRKKCVQVAQEIIDELIFPEQFRKYKQLEQGDQYYNLKEKKEIGYVINNILYRVSYIETNENSQQQFLQLSQLTYNSKDVQDILLIQQQEVLKEIQKTIYNVYPYKMISHEFRTLEILSDVLFLLRKEQNYNLKVPLSCTVEYMGFKILCISIPPLEDSYQSLVQGLRPNGLFKINENLKDKLQILSGVLNLRSFQYLQNNEENQVEKLEIQLSFFTEIHAGKESVWNELIKLDFDEEDDLLKKEDKRKKKKKKKKKNSDQQQLPEFYYLTKVAHIFPLDVDIQSKDKSPLFSLRLRPEYVSDYLDHTLSNGAFLNPSNTNESQFDDIQCANAGQKLRKEVITKFVNELDRLEIVPIDSHSLSQAFHNAGINIRLLGQVCQNSEMPHVQEICKVEMIARSFKKIFRAQLSEFVFKGFRQMNDILFYNISAESERDKRKLPRSGPNLTQIHKSPILQKLKEDSNKLCIEALNLLFGNTDNTKDFWNQILLPQIKIDFEYDFGKFPVKITPGGIIHSILYHTRIQIQNIGPHIKLFECATPFKINDIEKIKTISKTYKFRSLNLRKLGDQYQMYKQKQEKRSAYIELALKCLNIKLSIEKALDTANYQPPGPTVETFILAEIADLHLEEDQYTQVVFKGKKILEMLPSYHAESIKCLRSVMKANDIKNKTHDTLEAYDNSMKNLDYHWGSSHPLHAGVQCVMAGYHIKRKQFQDALNLLNNSLICCIRILGSNHIQTAEVYQDIAMVYYQSRKRQESLKYLLKALKVYETEKGVQSSKCANILHEIGRIHQRMGNSNEALKMFGQAMKIFQLDETKNKSKVIQCAYYCCMASTTLKLEDEIIFYAEAIWRLTENYSDEKNYQYIEYIIQQVIICCLVNLQQEYKTYLFKILLACKDDKDQIQKLYKEEPKQPNKASLLDFKNKRLSEIDFQDAGIWIFQNQKKEKAKLAQGNRQQTMLKSILKKSSVYLKKNTQMGSSISSAQNMMQDSDSDKNDMNSSINSHYSQNSPNKRKKIAWKEAEEENKGLFTKGLRNDDDEKKEVIEEIMSYLRGFKTILKGINNMVYTFLGRFELLYYETYFYTAFNNMLNNLEDESFLD